MNCDKFQPSGKINPKSIFYKNRMHVVLYAKNIEDSKNGSFFD